jgi:tight adherence protein B
MERLSTISVLHAALEHFDFVESLKKQMAESGLAWSVGRLTALILLSGALVLAILQKIPWVPGWLAILAACAAGYAPYGWVLRKRAKRLAALEEQLPDALDSLARAMRAGHPLSAGIEMLGNECPAPLGPEMRRVWEERRLGMSWDHALENLSRRVPILNMSVFVAAVELQSRAGGRLTDVLARLSESMREAAALKGEVQSLAAHGRITGNVLTVLPLFIAAIMAVVSPGYLSILLSHPRGTDLIAAAVVALVAAHSLIRHIVDVKL